MIQPSINPVSLDVIFTRLDQQYQPIATDSGNRLRVRPTTAMVRSDAAMLERIMRNLISNALRYTQSGRVLVATRRRNNRLRIEIYDTGAGIPNDELDNIFLEFHQLGNPERDRQQGLGLGLAIVNRLVHLLDHTIEVRSRLGSGSCFMITLPIASGSPRSVTNQPPSPTTRLLNDLTGSQILVLDDDTSILTAMARLLESWGCNVFTATSLLEAQALLQQEQLNLDLLIVDYRLRDRASGLDAAMALQEQLPSQVPVLVITGDTAPARLQEAQTSGYPLLHKPVQPAKLRNVVRHLIRRRK